MLPTVNDEARVLPQVELLRSLKTLVDENLPLLLPITKAWQPTDFLPDLAGPNWCEETTAFRDTATGLTDEVLVVLVGDMITEEALPNYAISLNLIAEDREGASTNPWARWMRGWVAEENRHGDLLNAFLRLTGRVDMRAIESTVHHLIAAGFDPRSYPDPYAGLIYTSFQERATKISHANVGRLATRDGDENLAKICRKIAGDESRHEQFYTRMMGEVCRRDPDRALPIFRNLIRRGISMPGFAMTDGENAGLFEQFALVAQRLGVYTFRDYAQVLRHLVTTWEIATLPVSGAAADAQEFLCVQADRMESMADSISAKAAKAPRAAFSWIHGREA